MLRYIEDFRGEVYFTTIGMNLCVCVCVVYHQFQYGAATQHLCQRETSEDSVNNKIASCCVKQACLRVNIAKRFFVSNNIVHA